MKFGIVVFPGSNCDHDTYHVLKHELHVDVEFLWHKDVDLSPYSCIILPGGFSYGDYLRCGAIAKFSPVMREVMEFAKKGGPVIGICNGFQILLEAGLLPGAMLRNRNLQFICRDVYLRVENKQTPFTGLFNVGDRFRIPIAHMEGNYFADDETLRMLNGEGRVIFRYCDRDGNAKDEANYNGAIEAIAGICNEKRNILGMMPHPERCSEAILGNIDGRLIFQSIVNHLEGIQQSS
ncbi:MAG: phosphoribosylformylglycinamidine synthase subunit PurQ [Acidobacteriota bacterium]